MIPMTISKSMVLKKEHANKILNVENSLSLIIPDNEFSSGDALIIFNNSDESISIESNVLNSYASGYSGKIKLKFFPARCLINAIFIDQNTIVFTKGDS
jgi:hypothetical protein